MSGMYKAFKTSKGGKAHETDCLARPDKSHKPPSIQSLTAGQSHHDSPLRRRIGRSSFISPMASELSEFSFDITGILR